MRRLFTRFIVLVLLPVVGLVGFGVMAITNERAAVEMRFQQEYAGRLRAVAGHLAQTIDRVSERLDAPRPLQPSPDVKFDFRMAKDGTFTASRPLAPETAAALEAALRLNLPQGGLVALVPVASGPARGLYAVRRDDDGVLGLAFSEPGLAAEVESEGRRRFPGEPARFTLAGPREQPALSVNPMRRVLDELTSDRAEANLLSLPLPPPLSEWRISAHLPSEDPIRTALFRNRTIYIVVLSLFYVIIIVGVVMTLRGISREMRLSRLKTDFVSNLSHELRTPLTSIRMFAETLKLGRAPSKEEQDACIDFIWRESERLSQVAERTLDWSRIEAGRRAYDRQRVAPEKLVRDVLETFFAHSMLPREALSFTADPAVAEIEVDAGALAQVLLNLLENAVKYTPQDKRLAVRLRAGRRRVMIDVEDNGIGIARRDIKRIFERFYRADDLLARRTEGTGLGLSIARRVVHAHGGRIAVQSRQGVGSTFTVELPAARPLPGPAALGQERRA